MVVKICLGQQKTSHWAGCWAEMMVQWRYLVQMKALKLANQKLKGGLTDIQLAYLTTKGSLTDESLVGKMALM